MLNKRKIILALIFCGLIFSTGGCNRGGEPEPPFKFEEQMFVMGTIVNVTLLGETEKRSEKLFHDLLTDFKYMQAAWNPWKKGSLGRINKLLPHNAPFSIGPALKDMILTSKQLSRDSEGYFNPAVGGLIKLWGFDKDELPKGPPPTSDQVNQWLQSQANMENLKIDALNLKTDNTAVLLDFGAFAKGYGVDKAIEYLKSEGVENALINAGGDLRAIGSKSGKPWVIGIRHPRSDSVIASLDIIGDESVFTSGDYERFYEYQGQTYHHILDPKTGYPAKEITSVTVVHNKAAIADAAATALFVAGPANWERIAKKMGIDKAMLIDSQGNILITPELKKRIKFEHEAELTIRVSKAFQ